MHQEPGNPELWQQGLQAARRGDMCPGDGAMDEHSHTSLVGCDDSIPRRTLLWRAVLWPDHTAWACSGLGVEFLPLTLPRGGAWRR